MNNIEDASRPRTPDDLRFAFGKNWARFLSSLNEDRISSAKTSLQRLLQVDDLEGCRILDAGSGSGLFSLAAHRLGANVTSFDVDLHSVGCTQELKARFCPDTGRWQITHGSLLDRAFLESLGTFEIVYCWGVAHHTGRMWEAIENVASLVDRGGSLILAIYNDQLYISRAWRGVKRVYQGVPRFIRPVFVVAIGAITFAKRLATTLLASLLRMLTFRNPIVPFINWARETKSRGMHIWHDLVDWVGGWPFEVARPEEVFRFLRDREFILQEMTTSLGHGCNEFVFIRTGPGEARKAQSAPGRSGELSK